MTMESETVGGRLDDRIRAALAEAERDPRMQAALEELRGLIRAAHPTATFAIGRGYDVNEITLVATLDVEDDDLDDAYDLFISRLGDMQIEEELPVSVRLEQPLEQVLAERRRREKANAGAVREPVAAG